MGITAPSAAYFPSSYVSQVSSTAYPVTIDGDLAVGQRILAAFAPRAWPSANMTMTLDPGHLFNGTAPVEIGAITTAATTNGSNQLSGVVSTAGVAIGQSVLAYAYIGGVFTQLTPTGAVVTAIAGSTITFAGGNAGASQAGATVVFGQMIGNATATGNTTVNSNQITALSSTAGMFAGMAISGSGIPSGASIVGIAGTTLTISGNATATATAVALAVTVPTQSGNPRIDRIVIDQLMGAASWVMGTAASSPSPPAIPAGAVPVCQLLIGTSTTAITHTSVIADERDLARLGWRPGNGTRMDTSGNLQASAPVSAISTNQTVTAASHATQFVATSAVTLTLPETTTTWNGWGFDFLAVGGAITLTPNASDKIQGGTIGASYTIPQGLSGEVVGDGAGNVWVFAPNALETTGAIKDFAMSTAPAGYLACDGSAVSRTTFAALFAAIGTTWGAGNGTTTFNVPDFRGRVRAGLDTNPGSGYANRLTSGGSGINGQTLGASGGAETVTLTNSQLPNLSVSIGNAFNSSVATSGGSPDLTVGASKGQSHLASGGGGCCGGTAANDVYEPTTLSGSTGGGGGAHQNAQPTGIVLTCIKT